MTLSYIFSNKFLFDSTPSSESRFYLSFIILFGAILLASFLIRMMKIDEKIRGRQSVSYLTVGILGFIYLGARFESLPWLGSRLFLALILLTAVIWFSCLTVWGVKYYNKKSKELVVENKFNKYLPKQKKKL